MSPRRPSNRDSDELIEEITVGCYDNDEYVGGFDNDVTLPCTAPSSAKPPTCSPTPLR
ncbi:MAG: hypothetical protein HKL83_09535 [Acidimicrobiaceae bacterium]|nr:hypothetical protein [Acidimicrobiaceae bacterium]